MRLNFVVAIDNLGRGRDDLDRMNKGTVYL